MHLKTMNYAFKNVPAAQWGVVWRAKSIILSKKVQWDFHHFESKSSMGFPSSFEVQDPIACIV